MARSFNTVNQNGDMVLWGNIAALNFGVGQFTVSCLFFNTGTSGTRGMVMKNRFAGNDSGAYLYFSSTRYLWYNGAADIIVGSAGLLWNFCSVVRNNTASNGVSTYFNNSQGAVGTDNQNMTNTLQLVVGGTSDPAQYWTGSAAHIQIFNRALNYEEHQQIMRYPGSITRGLAFYAPLFGTAVENDYSGNNYVGTVSSGTVVREGPPVNNVFRVNEMV